MVYNVYTTYSCIDAHARSEHELYIDIMIYQVDKGHIVLSDVYYTK